ncbi:MAG: ABC transporter permease subunit [Candidatus Aminicenantes bacterium]|nr:ABC transporter permease subunit [Candidatus Aminicenantes bacterium]
MFKTIVRKELLENILSYRFPMFFLITAVLILVSIYVHSLDYDKQVRDYSEQVRLAQEELGASRMSDLFMGRIKVRGFLPPVPLSILAAGFETSLPRYYDFDPEGPKPGPSSSGEESILSVFGRLDYLFIIQMVVSLIVLLFASDLIAGEKEMGTLRATLANSVPRHTVLMGKLTGGFLTVWLPFTVVFVLGLIVLGLLSFPLTSGDYPARLLAVFLATTVFLLVYYALGLMVSASSARSRTSLVAVLLVWIVFQLVSPRLSDMFAAVVHPARTETVVSMQKSLAVKTIDRERAIALGTEYVALFGPPPANNQPAPPHPEDKQKEYDAFQADWDARVRDLKASQLRDIEVAFQREKSRQRRLAAGFSLLSPSAAFSRLVTDLCGTGELDRARYDQSVLDHQRSMDAALYQYVQKHTLLFPTGGSSSSSSITKMVEMKTLPAFNVQKARLGEALAANAGSLISLAFWLIAPFALAYVRFLKYDVR